jgi:hypothetical protein
MYGFAEDFDFASLVGLFVSQIRMGRYDVQFHFGGPIVDTDTKDVLYLEKRIQPTEEGARISISNINVESHLVLLDQGRVVSTWDDEGNWTSLAFQRLEENIRHAGEIVMRR